MFVNPLKKLRPLLVFLEPPFRIDARNRPHLHPEPPRFEDSELVARDTVAFEYSLTRSSFSRPLPTPLLRIAMKTLRQARYRLSGALLLTS